MSSVSFQWKTTKLKKNGTRFNAERRMLTLVGRREGDTAAPTDTEDSAADYFSASLAQEAEEAAMPLARASRQALVFVLVSVACASAALASGTYAIWLTRRQAAQNALTDVRDLLRTCHDRMVQMEDELHRMPAPPTSASAH